MGFLDNPDHFLEEEGQSPLMAMNDGYLNTAEGRAEFHTLAEKWPEALGLSRAEIEPVEEIPLGFENDLDRIIDADVARTFIGKVCRRRLRRVLRHVAKTLGKYAQAIAYVAGFLLLHFDEEYTAAMLIKISAQLPDYWNTTAVGFATDAYVYWEIMETRLPEVVKKLREPLTMVQPETYLQSWFSALCVQIMPFETLVHYMDQFFAHGVKYLFQAALAVHEYYREELLAAKNTPQIFAIVRLDRAARSKKAITPELLRAAASKHDLTAEFAAFDERRQSAYNTHLKERLERAKKAQDDDFDIGSDLDDSDEDEE